MASVRKGRGVAVNREWTDAALALSHRLRSQGITIDVPVSVPPWEGGPFDYGWTAESLLDSRER